MRWKNTDEPLLKCTVMHQIPGRVRIHCRALHFLDGYTSEIISRVENLSYVKSATVSTLTSNILVRFSESEFYAQNVVSNVEDIISTYSIPAFQLERRQNAQLTVNERRLQEEPVSSLMRNVVAGALSLGWAIIRGGNQHKLPLIKRLTGFTALSSLSLSRSIFKSGILSMVNDRRPNADTLSAAAIAASLISGNGISALTIILLADTAELLTAYSMSRTRKAIREMLSTGEKFVWKVMEDDRLLKVNVDDLVPGDKIMVHTGEIISVDGYISKGNALVDESSITGEFMPKEKKRRDKVFAGSTVKSGTITVYAEKTQDETAAAKIIQMVEEASQYKAQVQNMADRFSAQLIPLNFALGALVFLITRNPVRALNMLVIDYSCGIRLSTATALTAAISTGARNGILIKGSNYLEVLADTETLIFDKTGTLTEGKPEVKSIIPLQDKVSDKDLLCWAAAAEETSTHPVAHAIIEKVRLSGYKIPKHGEVDVVVSRGVSTKIRGQVVRVGNAKYMKDSGVNLDESRDAASRLMLRGENLIYISKGDNMAGMIGIMDPLRENMKKSINRLRNLQIDDIILLTGDVEQQAEIVASRMMFDRFQSELMPEDKARFALHLQSKGLKVVMIGDGINDAPALAYADVGIALGSKRTDIAMEAADITIQSDNPLTIPSVIRLSRSTMRVIRENFATSIGVNSIGLVLGAMGVLPVFWGAFLHNMTTVAVVSNSLRLFFFDMEKK